MNKLNEAGLGRAVADSHLVAKQLISQVLEFVVDYGYIDSEQVEYLEETGDLEQLQDIAYYQISASCVKAIREARKQDAQ